MKKLLKTKIIRCRRKFSKENQAFGGYKIVSFYSDGTKTESLERYETKSGAKESARTCVHLNN